MIGEIAGLFIAALSLVGVYWLGGRNMDKKRDKDQRDAETRTTQAIRGAHDPDLSDSDIADSLRKHAE